MQVTHNRVAFSDAVPVGPLIIPSRGFFRDLTNVQPWEHEAGEESSEWERVEWDGSNWSDLSLSTEQIDPRVAIALSEQLPVS
jgi:hypothetical protein